jgi:EmrB/QacA subfamily drug resistance transporter
VTLFFNIKKTDWSVLTRQRDPNGDTTMFKAITSRVAARPPHPTPRRRRAQHARAGETSRGKLGMWALIVTSVAGFIVTLDNLVVTTALPSIHRDLHASIQSLEWTVNAYTLTFAVLLLTGAALGDRFGRKRMFVVGLATFMIGSAAAALAPSIGWLIAARAFQGIGGAIVAPLTLTILSAAVPAERRGAALGIWGAISGLAVGLGPVVGGAIVQSISWQWIFWLNVPIALALIPLALRRLEESHGPNGTLDLPGLALASTGLFGIVLAVIRGNQAGWTSTQVLLGGAVGVVLLGAFVAWELHTPKPMLPMRLFRSRTFSAANLTSLLMSFGMFGSVFLLTQFLQTAQGYTPLQAGLRVLPWTAMPLLVAPIAGILSDRVGGRPLMATGVALQAGSLAWLASIATATVPYAALIGPFVMAGIGMGMFFAPVANVVLGAVAPDEEGQASGANNAIRELGGVFGVAVLAAIFTNYGSYHTAHTFVNGLTPALYAGALIVGLGAVAALFIERKRRTASARQTQRAVAPQATQLAIEKA